jgi:hypothetical protein
MNRQIHIINHFFLIRADKKLVCFYLRVTLPTNNVVMKNKSLISRSRWIGSPPMETGVSENPRGRRFTMSP